MNEHLRILLIEDDDDHAELFQLCIGAGGRKTSMQRATDLEMAKPLVRDPSLDVIILDLGLPETQGIETLTAVMKEIPVAPVIVLTSVDDPELGPRTIRKGAQDYLSKVDLNPRVISRAVGYAIERAELRRELHAANSALSSFASDAAHDLQSPLRRIVSFVHLAEDELGQELSESAVGYLSHVKVASSRLSVMIESLLEFAVSGSEALNPVPCTFEEITKQAIEQLRSDVEESGATVRLSELSDVVDVDRVLMVKVMQNLIGNAIKYVDGRKPEILIAARAKDDELEVSVTDNGIGIAEANLPEIFKPLRRLHATDDIEGSGIGLAICQRVVAAHGGKIRVESTPGTGSTFFFTVRAD
jgi:signal transduction histidine kinase